MQFTLSIIKQMKSHNGHKSQHDSRILGALSRLLCVIMVMRGDKSFSQCPNNSDVIRGRCAGGRVLCTCSSRESVKMCSDAGLERWSDDSFTYWLSEGQYKWNLHQRILLCIFTEGFMCRQQEEEEEEYKNPTHTHRNGCTPLPIVQTRLLFLLPEENSASY